jgi:hypothetical protein
MNRFTGVIAARAMACTASVASAQSNGYDGGYQQQQAYPQQRQAYPQQQQQDVYQQDAYAQDGQYALGYGDEGAGQVQYNNGYTTTHYVSGHDCYHNSAAPIVGALLGAVVGHEVSGHHDRAPATLAGAAVGAAVGSRVNNCGHGYYAPHAYGYGYAPRPYYGGYGYAYPPPPAYYGGYGYAYPAPYYGGYYGAYPGYGYGYGTGGVVISIGSGYGYNGYGYGGGYYPRHYVNHYNGGYRYGGGRHGGYGGGYNGGYRGGGGRHYRRQCVLTHLASSNPGTFGAPLLSGH